MAFPQVGSTAVTASFTSGTSHDADLPASISSGDLLVILSAFDGSPTVTAPSGWTKLKQLANGDGNMVLAANIKKADGTEGSTATITTSASENGVHVAYRITDWSGDINDVEVSSGAQKAAGTTDESPDPDSISPSWGSDDNLIIACAGQQVGSAAFTGYPYADNQLDQNDGGAGTGAGVAICSDELTSATVDPGVFTLDTPRNWAAFTIAVKPAAAGGGGTYSPTIERYYRQLMAA